MAMSDQLKELSETFITKSEIPDKEYIETCLVDAHHAISEYVSLYKLPEAREGALIMRNLHDYQKQILQEVEGIRYAMAICTKLQKSL